MFVYIHIVVVKLVNVFFDGIWFLKIKVKATLYK